eukprot:NODE_1761_length_765_cov_280.487430_g1369_i0.p1 GENE.NODE_1761_length_765_cov_280.487430_g1369_i0~~NODE_1761_length_765_cov_280.487430_g1369_i0.p1  ORF type:complete len:227 (-),score=27.38 NODE_1761_length_765_cov_280.487430_g1369_i0:25-705(-)
MEVAYWGIRGLGAPLRMMCEYADAQYTPVNYEITGEPGNYDRSSWLNAKPALVKKHALTNLPYIVDGETFVTQSNACLYYLGRKYNLVGTTPAEMSKVDQCLCQVMDMRNAFVGLAYAAADVFETKVGPYLESGVTTHLAKFENWFKQQGTNFCAGNSPTAPDFHLWEMLDQHLELTKRRQLPSILEPYPLLKAFYDRFAALPQLQKYFAGPLHKIPMNGPMAAFK